MIKEGHLIAVLGLAGLVLLPFVTYFLASIHSSSLCTPTYAGGTRDGRVPAFQWKENLFQEKEHLL